MTDMKTPRVSIETPRLLIRPWDLDDAAGLKEAIDTSLEHLRPWMPWAQHEPESLDKKRERIARQRAAVFVEGTLQLGVFSRKGLRVLGSVSIRISAASGIANFGYWLRADEIRRGYATEAVLGCMFAAFRGLDALTAEIYCDPANVRSAAIPERLGYLNMPPAVRKTADGRDRVSGVWQMERVRFEEIHGATEGFNLRDELGRTIF
jgi:RimJ/RimL family protein N-acetyltransferase